MNFSNRSSLTVNISKTFLDELPIKDATKAQQKDIAKLVNSILQLNKELLNITENSDQWNKIKEKIARTDRKIDEEVYKL